MKFKSMLLTMAIATPGAFGEAAKQPSADFAGAYGNSPYMRNARDYDAQSPLDWPAADTREVAYARARNVIARWEAIFAADRLNEQIDRLKRQFEASPDYAAAKQAEDEAWIAYQQASASVTARLTSDPQYNANVALAADLSTQIDGMAFEQDSDVRRINNVSPAMVDLASAKLGYARRATALRAEALAADPAVAEAKVKLAAAGGRIAQLRAAFAIKLKDDAAVLALRESQREAKIAHLAADAFEDSARLLRRRAAAFAYYLHRSDSNPYYGSPYAGSGYVRAYDIGYGVQSGNNTGGNQYGFRRR